MTTIACRDGIMAADSAVWRGGMLVEKNATKIVQCCGSLIACAGDASYQEAFLKWFINGEKKDSVPPQPDEDSTCVALRLDRDGSMYIYFWPAFYPILVKNEHQAIGSGEQIAMAAMELGKTAIEAVELACTLDQSTRGPVKWDSFKKEG